MEKIFKETILISTKHISDTSLVHPYQKDFTKELQNLGNNVDSFTGYIATYSLHHLTDRKIIIFIPKR